MGYKLCSTILCAKSLKFPPSQKSVYLEIGLLIGGFFAISAVFQPYNGGNYYIKMISFEISLVGFHGPTLLRTLEKSYVACQVGLLSLILVVLPTICQTFKIDLEINRGLG